MRFSAFLDLSKFLNSSWRTGRRSQNVLSNEFRPRCNINEWMMFVSAEFQYFMSRRREVPRKATAGNRRSWRGIWKDVRDVRKTSPSWAELWEVWNGDFSDSISPVCKVGEITSSSSDFKNTELRTETGKQIIWKVKSQKTQKSSSKLKFLPLFTH